VSKSDLHNCGSVAVISFQSADRKIMAMMTEMNQAGLKSTNQTEVPRYPLSGDS